MTRPKARVFLWINRLLTADLPAPAMAKPIAALGPTKQAVARSALLKLLSTNPELASVFVDQCYDATPVISRVYFQVGSLCMLWQLVHAVLACTSVPAVCILEHKLQLPALLRVCRCQATDCDFGFDGMTHLLHQVQAL